MPPYRLFVVLTSIFLCFPLIYCEMSSCSVVVLFPVHYYFYSDIIEKIYILICLVLLSKHEIIISCYRFFVTISIYLLLVPLPPTEVVLPLLIILNLTINTQSLSAILEEPLCNSDTKEEINSNQLLLKLPWCSDVLCGICQKINTIKISKANNLAGRNFLTVQLMETCRQPSDKVEHVSTEDMRSSDLFPKKSSFSGVEPVSSPSGLDPCLIQLLPTLNLSTATCVTVDLHTYKFYVVLSNQTNLVQYEHCRLSCPRYHVFFHVSAISMITTPDIVDGGNDIVWGWASRTTHCPGGIRSARGCRRSCGNPVFHLHYSSKPSRTQKITPRTPESGSEAQVIPAEDPQNHTTISSHPLDSPGSAIFSPFK
ncbi:putative signal peptide protein [Puccinia sorghi]|uniref:Putative signal peptide protein n=1 Tax=Puccinia sorghi TaxID=27349 RepID=A0A0L6UJP0_9BASI|nr:putative signal peptide protein [Puccinia sorghi]